MIAPARAHTRAFDVAAFDRATTGICAICLVHKLACECSGLETKGRPALPAVPEVNGWRSRLVHVTGNAAHHEAGTSARLTNTQIADNGPNAPTKATVQDPARFLFGVKQICKAKLSAAIKHNRRRIPGAYDASRTRLNEILAGPPHASEVMPLAESLVKSAGATPRKNASWCIELLFSLAPNHGFDERGYFERCLVWTAERYGNQNILTADIHRDEPAPHMHVLVLALREGKLQGSAILGGKAKLYEMRADFESKVSKAIKTKPL